MKFRRICTKRTGAVCINEVCAVPEVAYIRGQRVWIMGRLDAQRLIDEWNRLAAFPTADQSLTGAKWRYELLPEEE